MHIAPPLTHRGASTTHPARRRRFRIWWLLPLALLIVSGLVFWWYQSRSATTTTTTTATVSQGALTLAVSGSGSVAAARTVDLAFQQAGTVTSVDVTVGDQVRAGQVLARIDPVDLQLQLQQAQASLKAAEATLAATKNGSATPQDLATAQAALNSAKAQLAQTRTGAVTDVQSAQAALAAAQAKLDALRNPTQFDRNTAQSKIEQAQTTLQSTRNSASQAKTNAQLALQNSVNALTQSQSKYATALRSWQHVQDAGTDPTNPTTTDSTGKKKPNKLNESQRQQYYDAFVQAQAALGSAENGVTQAQVAYDSARQSEVTQIQQAEAALQDAQQQRDALLHPSPSDLAQAQAALTQARVQLTNLQQGGAQASLAGAEAQVIQAQANLEKLTAPATDAELASAEASLLQAQANVATAQRNLDQARLTAPFDGVVSAVALAPGVRTTSSSSSSNSSSAAAITLVDRSKLHIDVNLSETDAAKVAVGQPVTLIFDALSTATLHGTVATIAPAAMTTNNVVTYAVQVAFDPGTTPVKVGMSATTDIEVQKVDNAMLAPSRAISTSGATKTVTLLQGTAQTRVIVTVETGLTSNGKTAITHSTPALKAGDVVVIPSTTTTTSTSTQRGGPGGMPFGP